MSLTANGDTMNKMAHRRHRERGFTLLEIMIVVALIAILAAIAVPMFFKDSAKAKAGSEVASVFSDLRTRIDQYFQENGTYPANIGESTTNPATPKNTQQSLLPFPTAWTNIKFRLTGNSNVYCGYTWVTGNASDSANIGSKGTAFGFTAPATPWYYLLARCDMDGDSATDSYYFSSSVDPTIQKQNEGK